MSLLITFPLSALLIREAAAQTTHEVKITDFAFVPQNLTINPGDTVLWNNTDPVIHTLWFVYVANGSTYLLSDPIPPDATWTHTFNDAVELQYYSFDKLWITGFINVTLGVHDVAVTAVETFKTVCGNTYHPVNIVYENCSVSINATVENQGDFDETFNVTAKYNGNTIETINGVYLASHTSTNVTFTWDTVGVAKGNYTISAYAWPVLGETDLGDNTLIDGWVVVTWLGDFDCDDDIDFDDIVKFADAYILYWTGGSADPLCDFDGDCDIDFDDIVKFADAYIEYWSP